MDEGEVFICYSREDTAWREKVNRFMQAMGRAKEFGFSYWDDSQIEPGAEWEKRITGALERAKAGLLLVSVDFLRSEFIQNREVPEILKRAQQENSDFRIFPLLLRPCPWEAFEWLQKLQLVNGPKEPVSGCTTHRSEEILTSLMWEISQHIERTNAATKEADAADEEPAPAEHLPFGAPAEAQSARPESVGFERPLREGAHEESGKYTSFLTNAGVVHLIETSPSNPGQRAVVGLICIFRTLRQRTWFAVTDRDFFCVLDDAKTAVGGRRIQWRIPLGSARPVTTRRRPNKATGLIDVGRHPNWLYTQRIHPDPKRVRKTVEEMIEVAERS